MTGSKRNRRHVRADMLTLTPTRFGGMWVGGWVGSMQGSGFTAAIMAAPWQATCARPAVYAMGSSVEIHCSIPLRSRPATPMPHVSSANVDPERRVIPFLAALVNGNGTKENLDIAKH